MKKVSGTINYNLKWERLGGMHYSAISKINSRIILEAKTDKHIQQILEKLEKELKMSNVKT